METENDYLTAVNELKVQFDEKSAELDVEKKQNEYYSRELLSIYGVLRLLDKSCKGDYLPLETLFAMLELLEQRLEKVLDVIMEVEDSDD
jgi:hypothetical protein